LHTCCGPVRQKRGKSGEADKSMSWFTTFAPLVAVYSRLPSREVIVPDTHAMKVESAISLVEGTAAV
jgi:hypothetical protein